MKSNLDFILPEPPPHRSHQGSGVRQRGRGGAWCRQECSQDGQRARARGAPPSSLHISERRPGAGAPWPPVQRRRPPSESGLDCLGKLGHGGRRVEECAGEGGREEGREKESPNPDATRCTPRPLSRLVGGAAGKGTALSLSPSLSPYSHWTPAKPFERNAYQSHA